ncbi:hypothetical protein NSK11_contig00130-0001, partial [Nocardia seriolae]
MTVESNATSEVDNMIAARIGPRSDRNPTDNCASVAVIATPSRLVS